MKVTINAAALRTAADMAAKAVSSRPLNPILGCVALTAKDGELTSYATDYDSWLRTSYPADVHTAATVAVSARLLAVVAAAMPAGDVDLVCEGGVLTVSGQGRARSTLPTMPVEDFPAWPDAPETHLRRVAGARFAAALDACARTAANASTGSPNIRRITLTPSPECLRIQASDAYRLLALDLPWVGGGTEELLEVALDPSTVGPMLALAKATDEVVLAFDPAAARFQLGAGSARAVAAVMGGKGIGYDAALGQVRRERHVVVDSRALLDLAVKVTPFGFPDGGEKSHPTAVITLSDGELGMRAGTDDAGSIQDSVPTQDWTGEDWRTGINPAYLADVLKALPSGPVRLSVGPPARPMHFAPAEQNPVVAQAVLMPIRIPESRQA